MYELYTLRLKKTLRDVIIVYQIDWHGLLLLKYAPSVQNISSTISTWTWPTTTFFADLQDRLSTLLLELGRGPGSLYSQLVLESPDPNVNPECEWDAEVRLGDELCLAERAFLLERKRAMRAPFAKLIGVPESEVDLRDIPIVGIAGSGGGRCSVIKHRIPCSSCSCR